MENIHVLAMLCGIQFYSNGWSSARSLLRSELSLCKYQL